MRNYQKRLDTMERRMDMKDDAVTEVRMTIIGGPPNRTCVSPIGYAEKEKAERLKAESPYPGFRADWIPLELWEGTAVVGDPTPGGRHYRQCGSRRLIEVTEWYMDGRPDRDVPFSELTTAEWAEHGYKTQALQYIGDAGNFLTYAMEE